MKKQAVILTLAGLALTIAAPAFAHGPGEGNRGLHLGQLFHKAVDKNSNKFLVSGIIKSVGTGNVVVTSTSVINVPNITSGDITIKTDANTVVSDSSNPKMLKLMKNENDGDDDDMPATTPTTLPTFTIASLAAGQKVVVTGAVSGSDLLATKIVIVDSGKILGKVTAVSGNTITITNGLTSESKTVTTDANTKVTIDGQTKAASDVQVGDSGWIKFKTIGTTIVAKIIRLFR